MTGFFREYVWKKFARSKDWSKVRKAFLAEHKYCAACGTDKNLQVHHLKPFSKYPWLELVPANLITLCGKCHFTVGHGGSWHKWNEHCVWGSKIIRLGLRSVSG